MDQRILAIVAGTALLAMLGLKLRGPGAESDLRAPPKGKARRISPAEVKRLGALVKSADEGEALRLIERAGYDEAEARKLLGLVVRLEASSGAGDRPPEPGWTEEEYRADGLSYGRAFDPDPIVRDPGRRGEDGAASY